MKKQLKLKAKINTKTKVNRRIKTKPKSKSYLTHKSKARRAVSWKEFTNTIIVIILSVVYTVVTILNIIGPLHINKTGAINQPGILVLYSILFWVFSLLITWFVYFSLRKKPEASFFILIALGIVLVITENFLWGWTGP